ncbi:MAG: choice-of-anchor J domain-containing protein [Verrucomicrobia bacterium]|nr:choice-of-anchor J domain-containing protein [Verrucomicrobiota bacterium]
MRVGGDWKEWREWSTDDHSIWQIGPVASGPGGAHSGTSCAATVSGGDYPDDRTARLVSPAFTVPAALEKPRLRFWHWWSFNRDDSGQVQITTNNGVSWQPLSPTYGADSSGRWTRAWLDLKAYAGQTVRLGFYFRSGNYSGAPDVAPGWYIDDVEIEEGPPPGMQWPDSFLRTGEASDRWTSDFGVWELGVPTSGPGRAQSGSRCLATILAGDYTDDRGSLVRSQPFLVPPASNEPRLRFWHWWSFNRDDSGQVQITTNNGVSWQPLSPTYGADSSGRWTRAWLDLKAYAGQTVRLGFYFRSGNYSGAPDVAPGWYIDDVEIEEGPPPGMQWPDSFEDGEASGSLDFGFRGMGVGRADQWAGARSEREQVPGDHPGGDYTDDRGSLVRSQPFLVPPASNEPRLRFWHWWSFNRDDSGQVQITTNNGGELAASFAHLWCRQ